VAHHVDGFIRVKIGLAVPRRKTFQSVLGIFETAFADKPPWRLGGKADADEERDRPNPLKGVRETEGPLVRAVEQRPDNTDTDELAETPVCVRQMNQDKVEWTETRKEIAIQDHCQYHSNSPTKVDVARKVATESNRTDLGRIGDGQRLEDAPRDA
jgi:hypothetical protein